MQIFRSCDPADSYIVLNYYLDELYTELTSLPLKPAEDLKTVLVKRNLKCSKNLCMDRFLKYTVYCIGCIRRLTTVKPEIAQIQPNFGI